MDVENPDELAAKADIALNIWQTQAITWRRMTIFFASVLAIVLLASAFALTVLLHLSADNSDALRILKKATSPEQEAKNNQATNAAVKQIVITVTCQTTQAVQTLIDRLESEGVLTASNVSIVGPDCTDPLPTTETTETIP